MSRKDDEPRKKAARASDSGKNAKPAAKPQRREEPEELEDSKEDFVAVDDPAAAFLDNAVKATPWWTVSLAFHGLVLACLPLLIFSHRLLAQDTTPIVITTLKQKVPTIDMPERKRGITDSAGLETNAPANDDPPIHFPGAEESDHNESADDVDYGQMKGDSMTALSYIPGSEGGIKGREPGKGLGVNDSIGVWGGSGGTMRHGGPFGGRFNRFKRGGGNKTASESAVEAGLKWLARHQSQDGSWSATNFCAQCKGTTCAGTGQGDFDVGVTGLSVLAFLGAGYVPSTRASYVDPVTGLTMRYGEVVRKGLKFLIDKQAPDGQIGPMVQELMYNHAIAALAITEAYGVTNAACYRLPAQKAVMFVNTAQNYGLGWRYTPHCGNNDTSVTGWCVMVLKSAQISGLDVSQTAFDGAKAWLQRVTDSNGETGYDKLGSKDVVAIGKNEAWRSHPSMTAVGLLCRIFIDKKKGDAAMAQAAKIISLDMPKWDPKAQSPSVDYYYWYYATLALYQYDGPSGAQWQKWNKVMADVLCQNQCIRRDGCADGSWPTEQTDRWGYAGGRVYGTAINVLTLESSYRYESVFGTRDGSAKPADVKAEGKQQ